jgi:transcriptional regulator with XRE-family HTH domain
MNKALLRAFRKSKMSNYELAATTGLSKSTIGRWVRGETDLAISNAEKIAKALGHKFDLVKCD